MEISEVGDIWCATPSGLGTGALELRDFAVLVTSGHTFHFHLPFIFASLTEHGFLGMLHLYYFITNKTGDFSKYFLFKGIYCLGNPLRSSRIHTYMHIHVCIHTHRHIHHRSSTWFSVGIPHPGWLEQSMYSVLCQETFLRWFYFLWFPIVEGGLTWHFILII